MIGAMELLILEGLSKKRKKKKRNKERKKKKPKREDTKAWMAIYKHMVCSFVHHNS
jgi:hypothetical protein